MSPLVIEQIGKIILKFGSDSFEFGKHYSEPPMAMQEKYGDAMLEIIHIIYAQHTRDFEAATKII